MKSFYECSFFEDCKEKIENRNEFSVFQEEIKLSHESEIQNRKQVFLRSTIQYDCKWERQQDWDSARPTLLLPIRDNPELLKVTIANLIEHEINVSSNIIVIDDRSEDDLHSIVIENKLSYLRVDNDKGFNFSMLNNIAAKVCDVLGVKTIVLWNSDLWCVKKEWFSKLIELHETNDNKISGSKLVYPPIEHSLNKEIDSKNIKNHFPHMINGKWRNRIQFGGGTFHREPSQHTENSIWPRPEHYGRFGRIDDGRFNVDRETSFVTGALQVMNLKYFIEIGGLNPSMSKNFQDVDLNLRYVENKSNPVYYGKDMYFYHDESLNFYEIEERHKEKKLDLQFVSDLLLFQKLWSPKAAELCII